MGDLAHTLQKPWRSLQDLQDIATEGKYGKQQGNHKPFNRLHIADLREEFRARSVYDFGNLQARLDDILCGVQRLRGIKDWVLGPNSLKGYSYTCGCSLLR